MKKENLREKIKKIFNHHGKKTITKEEFLTHLEKQGHTRQEAIQIYNETAKQKIIDTGLVIKKNEKGGIEKILVVEYMTEEDWEALEALEREAEKHEEIKRLLWENWEKQKKKIPEILKQLELE